MEVAGFVITSNDIIVTYCLSKIAILIAKVALNKFKKKDVEDVIRKP